MLALASVSPAAAAPRPETASVQKNRPGWPQRDVEQRGHHRANDLRKIPGLLVRSIRHRSLLLRHYISHYRHAHRRNPFFTGCEDSLALLHQALHAASPLQPQAISGLAGLGKTQLAIEYAPRFGDHYCAVLWMNTESASNLTAGCVTLASVLDLPEKAEQDQQRVVEAVKRWLATHTGWLLILDNVEDLALVERVLPSRTSGSVVLTTRDPATGTVAQNLALKNLMVEEGALLLLRRIGHLKPPALLEQASARERRLAEAIATALDGLPLALDQAGAYIEESGCSLADYLDRYSSSQASLLNLRALHAEAQADHPNSVGATLSLILQKIAHSDPADADLLTLCAFLDAESIPEELPTAAAPELSAHLQSLAASRFSGSAAIARLRRYSLLQHNPEAKTFSLHRLVQIVLKERLDAATVRLWRERVVRLVNAAFPAVEFATWPKSERCLPHALACVPYLSEVGRAMPEANELLYKAGRYLSQRGRYREAESLLWQAVALGEVQQGPRHLALTPLLAKLTDNLFDQKKLAQAEPLLHRALALSETHLGSSHLQTADILNSLATLYQEQGKYAPAESCYQRALAIQEQWLGTDHPDTFETLNRYAALLRELHREEEVAHLEQRSRERSE